MTKEFIKNYEKYKEKIYTYLLYRVNFNVTVAEDLTQEVFLKAFDKFDTFDQKRPFQSWIYQIAKNHLKNYYRTMGREVGIDTVPDIKIDTVSALGTKMEWEKTLDKIRALPEKYSEVLLMRFVDGLDNTEISEILLVEEGNVRTRISRALKIIKETTLDI